GARGMQDLASVRPEPDPDPKRLADVMRFVTELAQVTASSLELQPILDWVVERTTEKLGAEEGCLRLVSSAMPGGMSKAFKRELGSGSWPVGVAVSIAGYVPHVEPHLASPDLLNDPRFPALRLKGDASDEKIARFRSVLAVPLVVDGKVTGLIAVTESRPGRVWSASDVDLLSIVASSSAGSIEKARLRQEI